MFVIIFYPVLSSDSVIIDLGFTSFNVCEKLPLLWPYIDKLYILISLLAYGIIGNMLFSRFFANIKVTKKPNLVMPNLNLYIGDNSDNEAVFVSEYGLYQNFLVTGTIGSGKTSSVMYPFTKQLIQYNFALNNPIGMLILDVKGNYYKQVQTFCTSFSRTDDLIVIELGGKYKYNPLHKPNLKPSVLANRLKTILTLFSPNNSESYWLDKAEQVLTEAIKFCRLYNDGYVTFVELHKIINSQNYFTQKVDYLRQLFHQNKLSAENLFDLNTALEFFQNEFYSLDTRTLSILKSEITRITNVFVTDYDIKCVFCPEKDEINFSGFSDVVDNHKIVVLNMNIALYSNLSRIIAAYLKLDFQAEVLGRLESNSANTTAFICDEYHEYVTSTDAAFFAQSREAKCINIVSTQSYSSIVNSLKDNNSANVIIQNLVNKLWLRTDDNFTIENAQKQLGKEDKEKVSTSISENAKETNFDFLTHSLLSKDSNISESISSYTQYDYIYDTNFFTQNLETFSCLAFLSDGNSILKPQKLYLKPYFK